MKILKLILFFLVFLAACNKEDSVNNIDVESDIKNAALEERILDVNTVVGATKINSSTVKTIKASEIPETTDAIKIIVPKEEQTAFQQKGLQIKVGGSQRFDGVYLRAKDDKGNLSDDVLKIELQNNNVFFKSNSSKNNKKRSFSNIISNKTSSSLLEDEFEQTIDINFEDLEPGKFCYAICVYVENADGNGGEWVSQPGDVCVEVEAWGGNSAIAGDWNFIESKLEILETDNLCSVTGGNFKNNVEYFIDEEHCSSTNNRKLKNLINIKNYQLNNDGTFFMSYFESYETYFAEGFLLIDGSPIACLEEPQLRTYEIDAFGNWAYDEESNELTIVIFKNKDKESGEEELLGINGEGMLWLNKASVNLKDNSLVVNSKLEFCGSLTLIHTLSR